MSHRQIHGRTHIHASCGHCTASVSCHYNLQSDTWRSANNYKAIKQANPDGVETIIRKGRRWNCWQILQIVAYAKEACVSKCSTHLNAFITSAMKFLYLSAVLNITAGLTVFQLRNLRLHALSHLHSRCLDWSVPRKSVIPLHKTGDIKMHTGS